MLPTLPATYVDHVVSPYGLREHCDPNAAGEMGSMVGGLGVRVSIQYECTENNGARIKDACGRAFGGHASVAPLSWLLDFLRGRTWDEACALTPDDVMNGLCEGDDQARSLLPENVERGARFAVKAMRRALGIAEHGAPADLGGDGLLVCRCIGVGDRRIRAVIDAGATTASAVADACGAGTGCGSCRPDLLMLIEEQRGTDVATPDESEHAIVRIAIARAGPVLRALGLPLLSVHLEGSTLRIRTGGAAPDALLTERSAPAMVRQILRETVGDAIEVVPE